MFSTAPQAAARDVVVQKGTTVLSSLRGAGCKTSWLARVLADNSLTMASARKIKPGTTIAVPDSCEQSPTTQVTAATVQLITDEGKGISTDPAPLLASGGGTPIGTQGDEELKATNARLAEELQAERKKILELESKPPTGGTVASGYSVPTLLVAFLLGGGLGALTLFCLSRRNKNGTFVPESVVVTGPDGKLATFESVSYSPASQQLYVRCPYCSPNDAQIYSPVHRIREECLTHLDSSVHVSLRMSVKENIT